MKKLLTIILCLISLNSFGQSAFGLWALDYFDNQIDTGGIHVAKTGDDGTGDGSYSNPYLTIGRAYTDALAGDTIQVQSGTYYESLSTTKSGSAGNPITIMGFNGEKFVWSGFTEITSWTQNGSTYTANSAPTALSTMNVMLYNNELAWMARSPNLGSYWNIDSQTATSITSTSLSGVTTSTDARANSQNSRFQTNRALGVSVAGTTLTGTPTTAWKTNYKFFIDNDSNSLDQNKEYYFNTSTKIPSVYSSTGFDSVKVSTIENLVTINYHDYYVFKDIIFEGANTNCIFSKAPEYVTFESCIFRYSYEAINGLNQQDGTKERGQYLTIRYCTFKELHNTGINLLSEYGWASIHDNTFSNIGLIQGMGSTNNGGNYTAIRTNSHGNNIYNNVFDSIGYHGISISADSTIVYSNLIEYTCETLDDGAGIYTGGSSINGREIYNNIIRYVKGNYDMTSSANAYSAGIYLDEGADDVLVTDNYVYMPSGQEFALKLHKGADNFIYRNTLYGSNKGIDFENYNGTLTGNDIDTNLVVTLKGKFAEWAYSFNNTLTSAGTQTLNVFAHDDNDNDSLTYRQDLGTGIVRASIPDWETFMSYSGNIEKTYINESDLREDYNSNTTDSLIVTFPEVRIDFYDNYYYTGTDYKIRPMGSLITYPAIYGEELITNGDFASATWWNDALTAWSIGSGVAAFNSTSYLPLVTGSTIMESGKTYLIEFDINVTSGTLEVCSSNVDGSTFSSLNSYSSTQSVSFEYTQVTSPLDYICFLSQTSFNGYIDNVSVREKY